MSRAFSVCGLIHHGTEVFRWLERRRQGFTRFLRRCGTASSRCSLERRFAKPKLRLLKRIAIDEISLGKKHKFLTIVMDLDRGAIVFVGDGKGKESQEPFWRRLRHSRAKIQAVAADLSPAYSAAIRQNLPKAKLVFDRFPLVKLLHEHLTDLHREATDQLQKQV